jgi:hypothetical protein
VFNCFGPYDTPAPNTPDEINFVTQADRHEQVKPGLFFLTPRPTMISLCSPNDWALNDKAVGVHDVMAANFASSYSQERIVARPSTPERMQAQRDEVPCSSSLSRFFAHEAAVVGSWTATLEPRRRGEMVRG